jgi:AraC family transcriptional regulator, regulatory protein of adaptative response / methylated-DNA-[protein]-cysteine methyltransferase
MSVANMSEHIRYAWGESSLGSFLAAASDRGLVAFEFADDHAARLDTLRARFPDANQNEDAAGLADVVSKLAYVVDHPESDPQIALDMRGAGYARRVWDIVREIPAGQVKTYGEIAARMGTPRDARDVTAAIASNTLAILIPCHRVVKKDGSISGYRWGTRRKRALLSRETRT